MGLSGVAVDLAVLRLWQVALGRPAPYSGQVLGWAAAVTSNWWLNRQITFRDQPKAPALAQWLRFVLVNAAGGAANFAVYAATVSLMGSSADIQILGVMAGTLCGLGFNFGLSRAFVFNRSASRDRASVRP